MDVCIEGELDRDYVRKAIALVSTILDFTH